MTTQLSEKEVYYSLLNCGVVSQVLHAKPHEAPFLDGVSGGAIRQGKYSYTVKLRFPKLREGRDRQGC